MTLSAFLADVAKRVYPDPLSLDDAFALSKQCKDFATIALNLEQLEKDPQILQRYRKFSGRPRRKAATK